MAEIEYSTPAPRRRWSWGKRLGVAAVVIVVLLAVTWITVGLIVERQLAAEIARIRAAGEPLTWHELHGDLQTAGAGLEYAKAFAELDRISQQLMTPEQAAAASRSLADVVADVEQHLAEGVAEERFDSRQDSDEQSRPESPEERRERILSMEPLERVTEWTTAIQSGDAGPEDFADARRLLTEYSLVLDLLDRAATMDQISFDIGADAGPNIETPSLRQSREATSLLRLRGLIRARDGELDGAAESAISIFRLARIFSDQPTFIAYLVRQALLYEGATLVSDIASFGLPSPGNTEQLESLIVKSIAPEDLAKAVIGDRIWGLS